jgi:hypothetical protein
VDKHFPGDKGRSHAAVPSLPFNDGVTNVLLCTSISTYEFMAPCLTERREKFTFLGDISCVNTVDIVKDSDGVTRAGSREKFFETVTERGECWDNKHNIKGPN